MPASKTPRKKRVVRSPPYEVTRPWQIDTNPKKNMQPDNQIWGLSFFRNKFEGISKKIYGTKNMVSAVLYCNGSKFRSATRPKERAFAIFTRSRNANTFRLLEEYLGRDNFLVVDVRYSMQRKGMTRRSILRISFASVVCDGHTTFSSSNSTALLTAPVLVPGGT